MTITATPSVEDGCLMVGEKVVLTGVPGNVVVSPVSSGRAAFMGATSSTQSSRHVFSLGVLERGFKFLSLFREKIWWMIPRVGKSGCEIPMETQMLLLEARQVSVLNNETSSDLTTENTYILFLPVLDGQFRTSLQGTPENELQFCIESGDDNVLTSQSLEAVFINSGNNPFELITNSVKTLEKHKCTFSHIENKKIPAYLDWFGWCTWDAFYTEVSPQGIKEGLQNFSEGGRSPKFLIIDDGWQETVNEFQKEGEPPIEGTEFVYVWHALAGYWGGVLPSSETLKKYNPKIAYPIQSPGNTGNLRDIVMDCLEKYGVGFIDPQNIFEFYNDLHGYLASSGVDGVKVDVQNLIETLGSGYGGRVSLMKHYQEALEQSVAKNFEANNLICSMSHNSDAIYSSKKSAVARASEDFMPREPTLQTLHIASVAFNSLLLGEIVVPDWDMFQSKHDTAEFHAAARAIGGCAVYVSDKPGNHDFKILRKLVLPDGSVLRARYAGRPTRDCLFEDPVKDRKSLLKIWNLNKLSGIIGVFNCQGAGNWLLKEAAQETSSAVSTSSSTSCHVSPHDVEFLEEIAGERWNGDYAIYAFNSGSLSTMPKKGTFEVSLRTLKCEIYTISPIRDFGNGLLFTPLGLLDMYNSGGAIEALNCTMDLLGCTIKVKGRGCGRFGAYSSTKPRCCVVDMKEEQFTYNADDGLLTVKLQGECKLREIEFDYRGICV
ncbi:probable galactinol--sucrose galactosyltransferase 2 isoform X2 [Carya illinoinensis]|uniref:probable galactinol--sucrose galactosyltransferase 2 isoform X2 n=1 Tax=Carya illinoinensis TaxID=32201 RepID=UPI001C723380|nr:probable galactinol--sucrose galactosyltransferase 2 isoform X2 [Carya illinoinensis]